MSLLNKILQDKDVIETYIKENGMEAAVKKYGIEKLLKSNVLSQYKGTNLFYDDSCMVDKVYNKNGEMLGEITHLLSPFYKKLGYHFGPCLNGNIILRRKGTGKTVSEYGVFDKDGNQIIEFGEHFDFCFLPNGVAIMSMYNGAETNMVTIHYDGTVKSHPYSYIQEGNNIGEYDISIRIDDENIKVTTVNKDFVIAIV